MMFQWLIRLSCRPVIINVLDRTRRMNTEYGHERIMTTNTDSPRLAGIPGERYASEMLTMMTTELRQMNGFTEMIDAIYNCRTVGGFPQINSAAANSGAVELDDLIFHGTGFPPDEFSAGCDRNYAEDYSIVWGFPHIDSAAVDYGTGAVELDDLIFRRMSFPLDELSAGRVGDYIWLDLWTGLSVRNRSVTGSLAFGSSQRLGRCCLWLAVRWIGSADVPMCHHLLSAVSRSVSHEMETSLFVPLCRHPVLPDGGSVVAELDMYLLGMSLYALLCRHLLSFDPAVPQTASGEVKCIPFRHVSH